jgi:nicotinamide riboside kinase
MNHAPLQSKSIILRPNTDWYSDELRSAKTERRKAEREMRKTQLSVHKTVLRIFGGFAMHNLVNIAK